MEGLSTANINNPHKRKDCPTENDSSAPVIGGGGLTIKRVKDNDTNTVLINNSSITTNNTMNNTNQAASVSAASVIQQKSNSNSSNINISMMNHTNSINHNQNSIANTDEPTSVIRVIIENMLYPVTLEALHEVFVKAGKVDKIVTFTKNGKFQSLVQFNSPRAAQIAKSTLDNQNIYPNACFMRIDFSKLTTLNVRFNNDKSRDYTNPNLPQGSSGSMNMSGLHNNGGGQMNMSKGGSSGSVSVTQKNHNDPTSGLVLAANQNAITNGQNNVLSQHNLAQQLDPLLGGHLDASSLAPMLKLASTNPSLHTSFNAMAAVLASLQRSTSNPGSEHPSANFAALANGHGLSQAHQFAMAFNSFQQQALQPQQQRMLPCGPVLLASNLDEQLATPEALFTLFGVFGDVIRVKILFNKKDNALIQMAEANQAQVAQSFLDKQKVFGKSIRVTRSKHQLVQMPKEGNQSDAGLTKDFTNSPLHRFKIPNSRNYLNIYPPSSTLHVSNIPASVSELDISNGFKKECGFEFATLKFFPKDRKMALIRFNSVEHATMALIKMHNYQISDDNHLRVSFSKSPIHE